MVKHVLQSLAVIFAVASPAAAQQTDYGEAEYLNSCAVCHGYYGKGDGPLADELRKKPADLTTLSARNGGEFPYWRVFETIDGRSALPSHGPREMPVWGKQFLGDDQKAYGEIGGEAVTQERIHALTDFVQTLQK